MAGKKIKINRAPVMTLWAVVVAERLGYDHEAALTLGKVVAGLNAQSKAKRLGIVEDANESKGEERGESAHKDRPETVALLGRQVPVLHTDHGVRAVSNGKPVSAHSVRRYLEQKFGDNLADVQAAMETLADAFSAEQLAGRAYALYEAFRPQIPEGQKGWGAAGELDLDGVRALADRQPAKA
jgi:hypothetical protein